MIKLEREVFEPGSINLYLINRYKLSIYKIRKKRKKNPLTQSSLSQIFFWCSYGSHSAGNWRIRKNPGFLTDNPHREIDIRKKESRSGPTH